MGLTGLKTTGGHVCLKMGKEVVGWGWFSVCGVLLNGWGNGGCAV